MIYSFIRKNLFFTLIVLIIFISFLSSCKKKQPPKNWLAKVNNQYITLDEFRRFYELDPNFGLDSLGLPALKGELQTLIDQYWTLKEAQQDGMLRDPIVQKAIRWETKQAMLRALYRKIIGSQIKISEDDLRQAFLQKNEMVHVRHLFTKNRTQALQWYKALKAGKAKFKDLAATAFKDTTLKKNGGDLGWVKISELDENFVHGLDTLKPGELSKPVHTQWGFHIIQMIDAKQPAIIRESEFAKQRPGLVRWLRRQKGLKLSGQYIKQTIGKLNPQPDAQVFVQMWFRLTGRKNVENFKLKQTMALDNRNLQRIEQDLDKWLDLPFVHFKGGHVTLRQFINGMKDLPVSHRPEFRTAHQLSLQIAKWFRDQYLFKLAKAKGLDKDQQVQKDVLRFKQEELYYYYVHQIVNTLHVPIDIRKYFKEKKHTANEHKELAHFNTLQEWKWSKAQRLLHKRLRSLHIKTEIRWKLLPKENERIDWQGRIRMFMVRKPS